MHGRDAPTDHRRSRPRVHLHELRGTAQPDDADADAPLHAADERLFKEGGQPQGGSRFLRYVVQLRADSSIAPGDARNGGGCDRSCLGGRRNRSARKLMHYPRRHCVTLDSPFVLLSWPTSTPRRGGAMDMIRRDFLKLTTGALTYSLVADAAWAQTAKVEVHWLGQAATKLTTLSGKVIVIDPFLTGNPKTPQQYKNLDSLGKVDVILVTHGHGDHTGDVKALAARTGATVLGPAGLVATMVDLGWVAPEKAVRFGKGGRVNPLGPQITITQVRAEHSSEVTVVDPVTKKSTTYPGGEPCGFIVEFENGFKLYHMGDTGLFGDLRLIGDYYKPDLVMIPIGGHFVMDPRDAAYATKEMLKPKFAIPFHYATFPVLRGTPQEYQAALGQTSTQTFPISPGDKLTF